jgi:peptide/nickel transport system permease protein
LPSLVLGFSLSGSIARMVRARVVEVMEEQFVLAARSRGIPAWRTFFVYALRPALPAVLTIVATQFGYLLDGAVVTETVFTRRGLGKLAMQAIYSQDMPVIRGIVVLGALAHVLANLLADIAQAWLDPRVRETLA